MSLFPNGIEPYLAGGILIGIGTGLIFLTTGIIVGASSVFSTTWSWFSRAPAFRTPDNVSSRAWRITFALALVAGAALYTATMGDGVAFHTEVAPWRLVLGGLLVGVGTRMSGGCTSGHGICGLSSFSRPSAAAVLTFMGVAIVTAFVTSALGVTP